MPWIVVSMGINHFIALCLCLFMNHLFSETNFPCYVLPADYKIKFSLALKSFLSSSNKANPIKSNTDENIWPTVSIFISDT